MRIKLDENLPDRLVSVLGGLGHDTDTVVREGLGGKPDDELWPEVQKAEILVLRLSDDRSVAAVDRLGAVFRKEAVEAWVRTLVVVTDHKVRVRLPQARK